jgi:hypothetical protein
MQTTTHCFPIDEFLTNGMQRELGTFPAVKQKLSNESLADHDFNSLSGQPSNRTQDHIC